MDKKEGEEANQITLVIDEQPFLQQHTNNGSVKSEFYQQYISAAAKIEPESSSDASLRFAQQNIRYEKSDQYQSFSYEVCPFTTNHEVVSLKVSLGRFSLELQVLNIQASCPFIKEKKLEKGGNSFIRFCEFIGAPIAIKCIPVKSDLSRQLLISRVVKELAIMKICSTLNICPLMKRYLGFDLIVYDDYALIAMEKGTTPKEINGIPEALSLMHSYNIVHADIKPQNIVYSPHYNKTVFIDFGFSDIIKEDIGYKSLTSFKGTFNYCGGQMLDLFSSALSRKHIDLYYNDLLSLKSTNEFFQLAIRARQNQFYIESQNQQEGLECLQSLPTELFMVVFKASIINQDRRMLRYFFFDSPNCFSIKMESQKIVDFLHSILPIRFPTQLLKDEAKQFEQIRGFKQMQKKRSENHILLFLRTNNSIYNHSEETTQSQHFNQTPFEPIHALSGSDFDIGIQNERKLLSMDLFRTNKEQCLRRLFESMRFDKRNISFEEKQRIASLFISNFYPSSSSTDEMSKVISVFQYMADYCMQYPITSWKKNYILPIIYQMILLNTNIEPYIQKLIKRGQQSYQTCEEKTFFMVWLQKYFQILLLKYKGRSHERDLSAAEMCEEHSIVLADEIINNFKHSKLFYENSISRTLIKLKQLQSKPTLKEQDFIDLNESAKQIKNQEIKVFLLYYGYSMVAVNLLINKNMRSFVKAYEQIADLTLKQKFSTSNNYFHILAQGYYRYQAVLIRCEASSIHNQIIDIINCEAVFMGLKFWHIHLYEKKTGLMLFLPFLSILEERLFKCRLSRYLMVQFGELLNLVVLYIVYQVIKKDQEDLVFSLMKRILKRFVVWRHQNCKKTSIRVNYQQIRLILSCIEQLIKLSVFVPEIQQINNQIVQDFQVQLGHPLFTEDEAVEYATTKEPYQLQIYIELLHYKCKDIHLEAIHTTTKYYQLLFLISSRIGWLPMMQYALSNIVNQKLINKEKVGKEIEQALSISLQYQSFIYYLEHSVFLIFYTLQYYANNHEVDKMRIFLNYVSEELSLFSIFRYIDTFVTNIVLFYDRNIKFKNYHETFRMIGDIHPHSKELIICYAKIILEENNQFNQRTILRQIFRFIDEVNRMIRQAIEPALLETIKKFKETPQRKKKWITMKKESKVNMKQKVKAEFENYKIFNKEKKSCSSYTKKGRLNRKMNKILQNIAV